MFAPPMLEATAAFYALEAREMLENSEVPEYLRHVERRLEEEEARVLHYLDGSTRKALVTCAETELLSKHIDGILSKGFDQMMKEGRIEDLSRLYRLFDRVDAFESVRTALLAYIKCIGLQIVGDEEGDSTMVQGVLELRDELDRVVEQAFGGSKNLLESCKDGFEHFLNVRDNKPAELIAKFVDGRLRSGGEGITEDELESLLEKVMVLFRYIQAKDVFEAFYKKHLAKRLLLNKYALEPQPL